MEAPLVCLKAFPPLWPCLVRRRTLPQPGVYYTLLSIRREVVDIASRIWNTQTRNSLFNGTTETRDTPQLRGRHGNGCKFPQTNPTAGSIWLPTTKKITNEPCGQCDDVSLQHIALFGEGHGITLIQPLHSNRANRHYHSYCYG